MKEAIKIEEIVSTSKGSMTTEPKIKNSRKRKIGDEHETELQESEDIISQFEEQDVEMDVMVTDINNVQQKSDDVDEKGEQLESEHDLEEEERRTQFCLVEGSKRRRTLRANNSISIIG